METILIVLLFVMMKMIAGDWHGNPYSCWSARVFIVGFHRGYPPKTAQVLKRRKI